jgi:putative ABC transport system ATP-binding protein
MDILRVRNLTKRYETAGGIVTALDDVSFSVKKGEFVAVTGASGSGKSTLLHIIAGVDIPTGGNVNVNGTDITGQNANESARFRRTEIGLIYQFYNLIPALNLRENIILPLQLGGKKADEVKYNEILTMLNLKKRENHYPSQLSGGEQQRAAIARALITSPSLILADEPTGNLDRKNSLEIVTYLRESNIKYKQTLLLVTHDREIAAGADRIIELSEGKITCDRRLEDACETCAAKSD